MSFLREWYWLLLPLPVFGIVTGVLFATYGWAARFFEIDAEKIVAAVILLTGLLVSLGALVWIDCAVFVDLPFAVNRCRIVGF